jgi:5-methyltetrahydrofolate--homocysteine methyltransferase
MATIAEEVGQGRTLLSDGAWVALLLKKGLAPGDCPEMCCLTRRADVLEIARSYVEAGADMIRTNSFGASRIKLSHYGLAERAAEINEAAAAISREAAGPERHVLGSIGPTGVILTMGELAETDVESAFREQAMALERGGADAVCIETMSALDEACLAVRAARASTKLEVIVTFTFEREPSGDYRTLMGVSPAQMARAVLTAGAHVIGANCGSGVAQMIDIVQELRVAAPAAAILVHANAGLPVIRDGLAVFPESPEEMALLAPELRKAGANVIGGCCGTTPAHIRAMARALGRGPHPCAAAPS